MSDAVGKVEHFLPKYLEVFVTVFPSVNQGDFCTRIGMGWWAGNIFFCVLGGNLHYANRDTHYRMDGPLIVGIHTTRWTVL